ncbi:putative virulence-associated protein E [[Clostridium] sordellii ATCC 9714]|nr:putative virulence-associated protein E [[Clostridium] sordellii ATCC 9714] [Paeniclostridium sordellii ATCC 9714]
MRFDGYIKVSTCENRKNIKYKNETLLWSDFIKRLVNTTYTSESIDEYLSMEKSKQDDIKDVGGFVGGSLKDDRRKKEI